MRTFKLKNIHTINNRHAESLRSLMITSPLQPLDYTPGKLAQGDKKDVI